MHWTTFNDANVFTLGGYDSGYTPPVRCSFPFGIINCTKGDSTYEPYLVAHHLLLAHASAVKMYREKYKVKVCLVHSISFYPSRRNIHHCILDIGDEAAHAGWFCWN